MTQRRGRCASNDDGCADSVRLGDDVRVRGGGCRAATTQPEGPAGRELTRACHCRTLLRITCAALDSQLAAQTTWDGGGTNSKGQPIPTEQVPFLRAREVFVHHADLGLAGYGCEQWPPRYVREELRRLTMAWDARKPMGATGLPASARSLPELSRVLWLMGRLDVDGLPPAQVF